MCGIVYIKRHDNKPAKKMVWKRYKNQKTRGSDGFGFIAVEPDKTIKIYRATTEKGIEEKLEKCENSEIIFHHRTPTSTPNILEATHPIAVKNKHLQYHYYLLHNGIISNDDELKEKHNKQGFIYTTEAEMKLFTKGKTYTYGKKFNDSEALAIELALMIDGKKKTADTKGSVAFIMAQVEKKTKKLVAIFCGKNNNPLKIERNRDFFSMTSEGKGTALDTPNIFKIENDRLFLTDYKLPEEKEIGFFSSYFSSHKETRYITRNQKNRFIKEEIEDWENTDDEEAEAELNYLHERKKEIENSLMTATLQNDTNAILFFDEELEDVKQDIQLLEQNLSYNQQQKLLC